MARKPREEELEQEQGSGAEEQDDGEVEEEEGYDGEEEDVEEEEDEEDETQALSVSLQEEGLTAPAPPTEPTENRLGGWTIVKTLLVRTFFIYCISSLFRRGPSSAPALRPDGTPVPGSAANIYNPHTLMDMYAYVTDSEKFGDKFDDAGALFWLKETLDYGDWSGGADSDGSHSHSGVLTLSERIQNSGSLFLHVFFVRTGDSPNPFAGERYSKNSTIYKSRQLTKMKKRTQEARRNLVTGASETQTDLDEFEVSPHWHPNLTINVVYDHSGWKEESLSSSLKDFLEFLPGGEFYQPIVYFNDFWNLNEDYVAINSTQELTLTLTYTPLSLFAWQLYAERHYHAFWYSVLGAADDVMDNQDSLKRVLSVTSPYLVALTVGASVLHIVFELLAFRNDVQFWQGCGSLEGLSVLSLPLHALQALVLLLYCVDSDTNVVVTLCAFIALAIELWKITKVVDVKLDAERKLFGVLPFVHIGTKSTYHESETKTYDITACRYLSLVLLPLLVAYVAHSALYVEHRDWCSRVISSLHGFILTFGFLLTTPQLFINYKLRSVAQLPWRMLGYRALSSFMYDVFEFVIGVPLLHRLGCFTHELIFVVYLYQRWIYCVDLPRVDELGTSADLQAEPSGSYTSMQASPAVASADMQASSVGCCKDIQAGLIGSSKDIRAELAGACKNIQAEPVGLCADIKAGLAGSATVNGSAVSSTADREEN